MTNRLPTAPHATAFRTCLRLAGILCGALATVTVMLKLLDNGNVPYPEIGLGTGRNMVKRIAFTQAFGGPKQAKVVFLGDSTVISCPQKRSPPYRLSMLLNENAPARTNVLHLATYGMSSFEYYAFADRIAEIRPDTVVFAFNLQSLSERWKSRWSRDEMLGWIRKDRLLNAVRMPLHWWGVTFDRLLMYTALVRLRLDDSWYSYRREQVRAGKGLTRLRVLAQSRWRSIAGEPTTTGLPRRKVPFVPGNPKRFGYDALDGLYSAAFSGVEKDHPVLQLFAEVLHQFSIRNVPVVVYVVPINWEYMQALGFPEGEGLRKTLSAIESVVMEHGASLVDLHELLPDAGFADAGGHFTCSGSIDGSSTVARRLFPEVSRVLSSQTVRISALQ